jgi:hypothetical protein
VALELNMRSGKVIAAVMALTTLAGCAGQASYSTMQYLASARNGCAAGDPFLCGEAARWEAQAAQEAQQDANVKTAVAGVGVAAILGAVALGLASSGGDSGHSYHRGRGYHRGYY